MSIKYVMIKNNVNCVDERICTLGIRANWVVSTLKVVPIHNIMHYYVTLCDCPVMRISH